MKKLMSVKYTEWSFNLALLILRLSFGALMLPHGFKKFLVYADKKDYFLDFMGLGGPTSMALIIFAEMVCSGLVAVGLFTRLATIPIIVGMFVALVFGNNADVFGAGELPTAYMMGFIAILLLGPGKISLDNLAK